MLLLWLLLQLAAFLLAAFRIPLAAQYPQPAEFHAIQLLLAAQFIGSALLMPALFRTWQMAIAAFTSAYVLLVLACALAGQELPASAAPGAFLTLWIVSLSVWRRALPGARMPLIASGLATLYAAGGVLVWYLALDLGPSANPGTRAFGPLLAVKANHLSTTMWAAQSAILLAGILACWLPGRLGLRKEQYR